VQPHPHASRGGEAGPHQNSSFTEPVRLRGAP
jgi:hypothetical protein